jgi:hypothetical protein
MSGRIGTLAFAPAAFAVWHQLGHDVDAQIQTSRAIG